MFHTLLSGPASEPVSVSDAKNFIRADDDITQDDALLALLIGVARRYAESFTGRSFITQTWRMTADSFPGIGYSGVGNVFSWPGQALILDRSPVQSITSIDYTAMGGGTLTMPSTDYIADLSSEPTRITPVFGKIWPIPQPQIGSVRVTFIAGYGDTADTVPEGIRQWILVRLATLMANREEVAVLSRGKIEPLPFIDGLLDPYRIVRA